MTLESAIRHIRPNAAWTLLGNTYDGLLWQDAQQTKPTEDEVAAATLLPEPVAVPQEAAMWALKELCLVRGHTEQPPRTATHHCAQPLGEQGHHLPQLFDHRVDAADARLDERVR